ncbi:SulP family inorganic anion transporter [Yinghuangia sp. ASG 101]|uniref:SulP family inorganic anion transporter n=1 Tax=Yinghuangia sp. ASG 101 TaxID=2896848 RepID=UPI001E3B45CF|nr:SulP family inorganic anion transporter [Yinghuangia sp. ASG 101]UGQ13970.1 SulP family inorganic anion transporter [Yinghuangia sp. ASG 101]
MSNPAPPHAKQSQRACRRAWPVLAWLPGYRPQRLGKDTVGALTAWALIVPECVAYAQIAGVPPQNAFYAAPVALLAYALLGTSRFLIVGATSAAAVLSASTVTEVSTDPNDAVALSAALAMIAGAVLVVAGIARLGFLAAFLSEPALVGFLFGMALTIIVRQAAKILGVAGGDGNFFERAWHLLAHTDDWHPATIAVGAAALAALFALEQWLPRLPASLVVLAAGIAVSAAFSLDDHGVQTVGKIPSAVPVPGWPDIPADDWLALTAGAFGLALVVFAESYSIAGRFARDHGDTVDANREMTAMGAANVAAGLFKGFAVSGSASRSAAAEASGGAGQMVSVIAAAFVLATGAFLTPLFTDLPEPVLGAIVIVAVRSFLKVGEMRRYWRLDKPNFAIAATALVGVLLFDLLPGLLIAAGLSLIMFIGYASRPRIAVLGRIPDTAAYGDIEDQPGARPPARVLVIRPDGQLFFGNADRLKDAVRNQAAHTDPAPHTVVLNLVSSYRLGIPVLDTLDEIRTELAHHNIGLRLARVHPAIAHSLARHPLGTTLGPDHMHTTVTDAVHAARPRTEAKPA